MTLGVGVGLPLSSTAGEVCAAARDIEQAGLDTASLPDVLTGDGSPTVDCLITAAAVAAVTERVRIEFGVLIPALRPVLALATQLLTLQHLSAGRVVLGVGAGGFPGSSYWQAAHAPTQRRGRSLEAILERLPGLIAGQAALDDADHPVTLAPPAPVPPILVAGHSATAQRRAVSHGNGWFPPLMAPDTLAARVERLRQIASDRDQPRPLVHFGTHAALGSDAPEQATALRVTLTDAMGMDADEASAAPITGSAEQVAERLAAYAAAGADSMTLSLDGADWRGQLDVVAEARQLLLTHGTRGA